MRNSTKRTLKTIQITAKLKTAKILAIIALAIGALYFGMTVFNIMQSGGWEGAMEQSKELMEQWGIEE